MKACAAREVGLGEFWAFREHRSLAEVEADRRRQVAPGAKRLERPSRLAAGVP